MSTLKAGLKISATLNSHPIRTPYNGLLVTRLASGREGWIRFNPNSEVSLCGKW
jgi:hypothetical protein